MDTTVRFNTYDGVARGTELEVFLMRRFIPNFVLPLPTEQVQSLSFAGNMAVEDMWRQWRVYREGASDPMLIYAATRRFVVVTASYNRVLCFDRYKV